VLGGLLFIESSSILHSFFAIHGLESASLSRTEVRFRSFNPHRFWTYFCMFPVQVFSRLESASYHARRWGFVPSISIVFSTHFLSPDFSLFVILLCKCFYVLESVKSSAYGGELLFLFTPPHWIIQYVAPLHISS
jgi:hypothetical protein